ncbi:MAG TPA: HesA/MoeB/ThiF family protein [Pyrodictium delaneyi]|uniref:HesA/MoeB/ThiF family protein n=1 Tax=Pyrodictium delaneyi TaxID=1273541 RepID=A0A832ZU39_9CREN|nr:HesA/MoeB/ThiF family protein [Pyrodictium delaneyi]
MSECSLDSVDLSPAELLRYERQLLLFGAEGQKKLKKTSVLVAGVGGLGSFEALYLTALGVGKLVLVDGDTVEETNLNRQVLHWTDDIGRPKPISAAEKLRRLNPNVEIVPVTERITEDNVDYLVRQVDIVIDGLDNWETRFLLDEAAYRAGKPYIHAGIYGFEGQVVVVVPGETPCLRCLLPSSLKSPSKIPAAGPIVALVGSIAVTEFMKLVTGVGEVNKGKMIVVDAYTMDMMKIELRPRKDCKCS